MTFWRYLGRIKKADENNCQKNHINNCLEEKDIVRIIGGEARGLRLKTLEGDATRPTRDFVKESLFNIISMYIQDKTVLDAFAGSGALGIESLSRGAKEAVFLDMRKESCKIIEENIKFAKMEERADILCVDALKAEIYDRFKKNKFDLIFLDPPYEKDYILKMLDLMMLKELFSEEALIIAEHGSEEVLPDKVGLFSVFKKKKYGATAITIYEIKI